LDWPIVGKKRGGGEGRGGGDHGWGNGGNSGNSGNRGSLRLADNEVKPDDKLISLVSA